MKIKVVYQNALFQKKDEIFDLPDECTYQTLIDIINSPFATTTVVNGVIICGDKIIVEGTEVHIIPQLAAG